eukprot:TRINITY_DN3248_c0_g1_i1.p1 TRINITY_DN3248_c0_g1~~TRINITY_DN3248_c0_g1_i1.p1  ORF type:complete len:616 (+),score=117.23 TRINITY_DN3248_c0_g1_i1:74-1921(+)
MSTDSSLPSQEHVTAWMAENHMVKVVDEMLAQAARGKPTGAGIPKAIGEWGRVTSDVVTEDGCWKELQKHYLENGRFLNMSKMFAQNPNRFQEFSQRLNLNDEENFIFADYSKNLVDSKTMELLFSLAKSRNVEEMRDRMFAGEKINFTENRAVLHTALRNQSGEPILVDGKDVMPDVKAVLEHMKEFSEQVRNGEFVGHTGKKINHIVNIGIGGSDLGPLMVYQALQPYCHDRIKLHFVSNIDGTHLAMALKEIDIETTLFVVASKTFTTAETITNATSAKNAVIKHYKSVDYAEVEGCIAAHFVALSTNTKAVTDFGISEKNMFQFWDWVGGRYSVWSAIGLSVCIAIGFDNYNEFLNGGYQMDQHFKTAPLEENIPVILALLGIWYNNLHGAQTQMILPYDQYLIRFATYFQQADMESNGKFVDREGKVVNCSTGPILLGEPGTGSQHSFFQLIHQGTKPIPCDFIGCLTSHNPISDGKHHKMLMANYFAQTEALMTGKSEQQVRAELEAAGTPAEQVEKIAPHKVFAGNRPTSSILVKKLTPRSLGALISMYEMKIFTQGIIWNINSFDQWGVELGKALAKTIEAEIQSNAEVSTHDSSTNGLINLFNSHL